MRGYKKHLAYASKAQKRSAPLDAFPRVEASFVDWRLKGVVSSVKDQGECGSCWTFSAAESVESFAALQSGNLQVLSEQQILDCTPNPGILNHKR